MPILKSTFEKSSVVQGSFNKEKLVVEHVESRSSNLESGYNQ